MPKTKIIFLLAFLAIILCVFLAYSNSLRNPFIWDDNGLILKNNIVLDWHNWPDAFKGNLGYQDDSGSNFYRPLQILSFIWDYHLWKSDPYGFHLTNITLQALSAFLLFLLLYNLLADYLLALFSALLFSVSPLNTESVTYISGRAEPLLGLFIILSLLLFIWAQEKRGLRRIALLILSWLAFILALLSKELALVFPLIVAAYILYYRKIDSKPVNIFLKKLLPFIVIALGYVVLRLAVINCNFHQASLPSYPFLLRLTVLPKIIFMYLKLLCFPVDLHMAWTVIWPKSFLGIFFSWFVFGAICVACWRVLFKRGDNKALCFLLLWSLIFFLPQSGIFPINSFFSEHFIYLPAVSFYVLLVYLLKKYLRKSLFLVLVSSVVFYYGLLTYLRNFDWGNPVVFYEKIIKFSPASSQAHNNLGLEWEYRHNYDLAISEYKKALELNPESSVSRLNLANLYFNTEKYKEAKVQYDLLKRDASSLRLGEIENNIGCIYEIDGLWKSAEDSYKLALKLNPKLNFTHFNLAKIYQTQRKLDLCAQEIFASLPELKSFPQKSGQYLSFINTYIREVKIFNSKVFYEGLGVEFAKGGLPEAAVASFKRLLELEPYSSNVYYNLGLAYYQMGKRQEAIIFLNKAIEISPNHLQAKGFLRMATSAKQIKSK